VSDRLQRLSDDELGRALAGWVEWPESPPIGAAVVRRIREAERTPERLRPRLSLPSRRRTILILVAATLALATAAVAAKLVIDLGAITVTTVPSTSALPTRTLGPADFGTPVSLDEAEAIAGFPARIPSALGEPDRVWVDLVNVDFSGGEVTTIVMAWKPREGLPAIPNSTFGAVLMAFRGEADVASKILTEDGASMVGTTVNGADGTFIVGSHELDLLVDGAVRRFVVTGSVVLWEEGELAFRLETSLDEISAVEIAES
jgi:hypothetical protein